MEHYSENTKRLLENSLSASGDCAFYVRNSVITMDTLDQEDWLNELLHGRKDDKNYPESYLKMDRTKLNNLTHSLIMSLASFVPDSYVKDVSNMNVMNLLTLEQLIALKICKNSSRVLLLGFAGSGKTVVAVEYIKDLRNDVETGEILFVTFSNKLAEHIR